MNIRRIFGHRSKRQLAAALAGTALCLALASCGSSGANVLPSTTPQAKGVPSGPVLGYIFSPTDGTLRAMLGVRGSAQISASLVPAGVYVAGDASTASSAGLLEDASGSLFAFNLPASQPIHVADNFSGRAQIAFAPYGQIAIAYAPGSSSLLLITGLPSSPLVTSYAVPSSVSMTSAAVSDAGTVVLWSAGSTGAVGLLTASGQFSRVASVSAAGELNFIPGSDDLLLADQTANKVSVVRNVSSNPALQALSAGGVNQPVAVAASRDKHWAIVANGGDQNLVRVDLTTGSPPATIACACQPTQLSTLSGGSGFRVNVLGSGPVWTVDVSAASPQLLFVPAIRP